MEYLIITGCSGRIGSRLAQVLKDDFHIIGLDVNEPKGAYSYEFLPIDVASTENVQAVFSKIGKEIFGVIHLIAYYNFAGGDPHLYQEITVEGTKRILDACQKLNPKIFLFTSTLLVHKPCKPHEKIDEEWPVEPKWEYPKSKVQTEKLIMNHPCPGKKVILRLAGCYDDECHSIPLAQNIRRIFERRLTAHLYPGNLSHGNPFVHFNDVIDAIFLMLKEYELLEGKDIFLISEEETLSYGELQKRLSRLILGKEITIFRVPKWFAKFGAWLQLKIPFVHNPFIRPWMIDLTDDHYEVDISKIKNLLNWEPKHSLIKSLPRIIEGLKSDHKKWYKDQNI